DLDRQQDVAPRLARRGAPVDERSAGPSRVGGRCSSKEVPMTFFVGLDWATREHAVCVVDERGAVVARFTAAHTASGMADLVARLTKLAPAPELRLAIERPTGLIVDTLVEQQFAAAP